MTPARLAGVACALAVTIVAAAPPAAAVATRSPVAAVAGIDHPFVDDDLTWVRTYDDPAEAVPLDLRTAGVGYDAWLDGIGFGVVTPARVDFGALAALVVRIDADRSDATGCDGFERELVATPSSAVGLDTRVVSRPTCGAAPEEVADATWDRRDEVLGVAARRTDLGIDDSFEWVVELRPVSGAADRSPSTGARVASGFRVPFPDLRADAYYTSAVRWLVDRGITTGIDGRYRPDDPVDRAQMATFLWRYEGSPAAPPPPFADVPSGTYYTAAVGWLAAAGLTTGVGGSDRYEPARGITRGEMVTLMWRLVGSPGGYPSAGFPDVPAGAFYARAVAWAAATGVTTGVGSTGAFQPDAAVTRGQMATFLERLSGQRPPA